MSAREVHFRAPDAGGRLDVVLSEMEDTLSRTRWQALIKEGWVLVDGEVVERPAHPLAGGERVAATVPPPEPSQLEAEDIPLDVLYEDERILVVNKPPGMVVHPGPGHPSGTLVHAALAHAPDVKGVGGIRRPGVVHRLDKDTSGVILLAKDDETHQHLQRQFKERQVEKRYLTLVDGSPPTPSGRVEAAIGRHPTKRKRMAVVAEGDGRMAISIYHTIETFPAHTLLEIHPRTGRTHQIRVHLAFLECPVVGDTVYGRRTPSLPVERQMLHAASIEVVLPGEGEARRFEAPLADDFSLACSRLRRRTRGKNPDGNA